MAQNVAEWEHIPEFVELAEKLISKYPDKFMGLASDQIIAYVCKNKSRPAKKKEIYKVEVEVPPASFTNSKTYFVKMFSDDWEKDINHKVALVYSVLLRIDPNDPQKIRPLDYSDQEEMLSIFGVKWFEKDDLPNLLEDTSGVRH